MFERASIVKAINKICRVKEAPCFLPGRRCRPPIKSNALYGHYPPQKFSPDPTTTFDRYPQFSTSILRFIVDMMWKTHPTITYILTHINTEKWIAQGLTEKNYNATRGPLVITLFSLCLHGIPSFILHFFRSHSHCKSVPRNNRLFALSFLSFVKEP